MKKRFFIKLIASVIIFIGFAGGGVWSYFAYKKQDTEKAVEHYLIDNGTKKSEIKSLQPFIANLEGDKNYMVAVKLEKDKKTYYYYKERDKNRVVLESYVLNGKTYME
jgi:flagellar basal body-associated protein FliL